ncbi:hypothetical protein [Deinococcus pimensis]|uniref:hypothetical protein n=1 Tax=Deinococcus pimensis TaxID=309888 RepID=UPI000481FBFD|nr:hypothetical protein [Deinococcus pimensis]
MRRTIAIVFTALVSNLLTACAPPALNATNSATVWLRTTSGPAQLVDMYVDGQLVARSMFPYTTTFQGMPMTLGDHGFTVVPAGRALGTADLMSKTLNVSGASRNLVMVFSDGKFDEDRFKMELKSYRRDP